MECLKLSLNGEKALVIFEGLSTLFLTHKVRSCVLLAVCNVLYARALFVL
jgi:hypothetical protein